MLLTRSKCRLGGSLWPSERNGGVTDGQFANKDDLCVGCEMSASWEALVGSRVQVAVEMLKRTSILMHHSVEGAVHAVVGLVLGA